jgi:hypothetical protein
VQMTVAEIFLFSRNYKQTANLSGIIGT